MLNILSTMKKAAMQKASAESRERYSQAVTSDGRGRQRQRQARSEVDLSQIPGSCSYLRRQFDAEEEVRGFSIRICPGSAAYYYNTQQCIQTCAEKKDCFTKHQPGVAGCGWLQPGRNFLST